jgi:putative oxidoreductase
VTIAPAEVARRAFDLRGEPAIKDCALAAGRVALAWIFIYHGAGTLFGAFHGPGLHRVAVSFEANGLSPGMLFAVLNGITEFFGGIAVGLGLLSRLAGIGLFFDMVIAMITTTWKVGIVSSSAGSGYELNLALAALALIIVLLGAGRASADAWVGALLTRRAAAHSWPVLSPSR